MVKAIPASQVSALVSGTVRLAAGDFYAEVSPGRVPLAETFVIEPPAAKAVMSVKAVVTVNREMWNNDLRRWVRHHDIVCSTPKSPLILLCLLPGEPTIFQPVGLVDYREIIIFRRYGVRQGCQLVRVYAGSPFKRRRLTEVSDPPLIRP